MEKGKGNPGNLALGKGQDPGLQSHYKMNSVPAKFICETQVAQVRWYGVGAFGRHLGLHIVMRTRPLGGNGAL